jgi:hypothetical protein
MFGGPPLSFLFYTSTTRGENRLKYAVLSKLVEKIISNFFGVDYFRRIFDQKDDSRCQK